MNNTHLARTILYAVGLPVRGNEEFALDALASVAAWKRWSHEGAAKWLAARARAAQDAGVTVDKWWFVNGAYRDDPRPRDAANVRPQGDPKCPRCSGTGWRIITRALPDGVTMRDYATRCSCCNSSTRQENAPHTPDLGGLAREKSMDNANHFRPTSLGGDASRVASANSRRPTNTAL